MNFQSLINLMKGVVKTNGSQSITGANLQSTLESIINTLGTGYTFLGVATTATTPPTNSDAKIFYIANGAGTYTNFGGSAITENYGVLYWDSSWHAVSLAAVKSVKTLDGNTLTGGGNISLKTVGSQNLIGSGDINLASGYGRNIFNSSAGIILQANKLTTFTAPISNLSVGHITTEAGTMNEYVLEFTTAATVFSFVFPTDWVFKVTPTIEANKHYRIRCIMNYATIDTWAISSRAESVNNTALGRNETAFDVDIEEA